MPCKAHFGCSCCQQKGLSTVGERERFIALRKHISHCGAETRTDIVLPIHHPQVRAEQMKQPCTLCLSSVKKGLAEGKLRRHRGSRWALNSLKVFQWWRGSNLIFFFPLSQNKKKSDNRGTAGIQNISKTSVSSHVLKPVAVISLLMLVFVKIPILRCCGTFPLLLLCFLQMIFYNDKGNPSVFMTTGKNPFC